MGTTREPSEPPKPNRQVEDLLALSRRLQEQAGLLSPAGAAPGGDTSLSPDAQRSARTSQLAQDSEPRVRYVGGSSPTSPSELPQSTDPHPPRVSAPPPVPVGEIATGGAAGAGEADASARQDDPELRRRVERRLNSVLNTLESTGSFTEAMRSLVTPEKRDLIPDDTVAIAECVRAIKAGRLPVELMDKLPDAIGNAVRSAYEASLAPSETPRAPAEVPTAGTNQAPPPEAGNEAPPPESEPVYYISRVQSDGSLQYEAMDDGRVVGSTLPEGGTSVLPSEAQLIREERSRASSPPAPAPVATASPEVSPVAVMPAESPDPSDSSDPGGAALTGIAATSEDLNPASVAPPAEMYSQDRDRAWHDAEELVSGYVRYTTPEARRGAVGLIVKDLWAAQYSIEATANLLNGLPDRPDNDGRTKAITSFYEIIKNSPDNDHPWILSWRNSPGYIDFISRKPGRLASITRRFINSGNEELSVMIGSEAQIQARKMAEVREIRTGGTDNVAVGYLIDRINREVLFGPANHSLRILAATMAQNRINPEIMELVLDQVRDPEARDRFLDALYECADRKGYNSSWRRNTRNWFDRMSREQRSAAPVVQLRQAPEEPIAIQQAELQARSQSEPLRRGEVNAPPPPDRDDPDSETDDQTARGFSYYFDRISEAARERGREFLNENDKRIKITNTPGGQQLTRETSRGPVPISQGRVNMEAAALADSGNVLRPVGIENAFADEEGSGPAYDQLVQEINNVVMRDRVSPNEIRQLLSLIIGDDRRGLEQSILGRVRGVRTVTDDNREWINEWRNSDMFVRYMAETAIDDQIEPGQFDAETAGFTTAQRSRILRQIETRLGDQEVSFQDKWQARLAQERKRIEEEEEGNRLTVDIVRPGPVIPVQPSSAEIAFLGPPNEVAPIQQIESYQDLVARRERESLETEISQRISVIGSNQFSRGMAIDLVSQATKLAKLGNVDSAIQETNATQVAEALNASIDDSPRIMIGKYILSQLGKAIDEDRINDAESIIRATEILGLDRNNNIVGLDSNTLLRLKRSLNIPGN